MGRVTGIGGVFFKCDRKEAVRRFYGEQLGIPLEEWGASFLWRELDEPAKRGYTVLGTFASDTSYFDPSDRPFMVNFRVEGIEELVAALRAAGSEVISEIEQHENGRFAWVLDPEGTKIELWEPIVSSADPYLPPE